MAILEDVPGIEVAITVNGNDLKEYEEDDIVNEPKTVTKYIEATSGVNFGIRYSVARRFPMKGDCITFSMYLDNEKCGSSVVTKASRIRKCEDLTGNVVEALKSLRIIGRTPTPVPLEERPLEELSADQLREIIRQKNQTGELERKIKREGSENGVTQRKKPRVAPEYLEIDDDDTVRVIEPPPQTAISDSFSL
ncbi:hypothetical protein LTR04_002944 [Oleoguttula sp. CCFEE 6159]|nr:hypothetical protein LTR04_002944 [Oleoguttula sp. CCFEE 6159]